MTGTDKKPLHVLRLEVSNYLGIRALRVDAKGKHVKLTGANGAGKTSALQALWDLIKGISARTHPEPIHGDEDKAVLRGDFGEFTVERVVTPGGMRLTVNGADGTKIPKPQAFLDSLAGSAGFNLSQFLDSRPQDQSDTVLTVCKVACPTGEVKALLAPILDASDRGQLDPRPGESADAYLSRLSADETGLVYLRRREANRIVDQKRAALEEQRRVVDLLGGTVGAKPVSGSALLAELATLQEQADTRRGLQADAENATVEHTELVRQLRQVETEKAIADKRVEELRRQLTEAEKSRDVLLDRIAKGKRTVTEAEADMTAAQERAAKAADPSPRIAELRQELKTVEADAERDAKRRHAAEQQDRLAIEVEEAQACHARFDKAMDAVRALRAHLLDGLDLGLPGLSVGNGELRYKGKTFRQASTAERIRVAVAVAVKSNPRLAVIRLDDAEHLDAESERLLFKLADRHGFQCWLTEVAKTGGLKVQIVDGAAA